MTRKIKVVFDDREGFQPKECTYCGFAYSHPMTDSYANYDFDCSRCKSKATLKDKGNVVTKSGDPWYNTVDKDLWDV